MEASTTQNCTTCKHCYKVRNQSDPLAISSYEVQVCRANPPAPAVMPTPQGVGIASFFPQVTKDIICDQYKPKKQIVS